VFTREGGKKRLPGRSWVVKIHGKATTSTGNQMKSHTTLEEKRGCVKTFWHNREQ